VRDGDRHPVRMARATDAAGLARLVTEFRDYLAMSEPAGTALAEALPRCLADPSSEFLVAENAGRELVGFVQLRLRSSLWYGLEAEVEDLFVAAAARGGGVGRRLIAFAIERARARGCTRIGLTTNENNQAAVALYESVGFDARRARWQGGRQLWLDQML